MAASPSFASTGIVGSGLTPGTADTSFTAPSNVTAIILNTASPVPYGTSGASRVAVSTKVEELIFQGVGTTTASKVQVFLVGATGSSSTLVYDMIDQITVDAVTPSASTSAFRTYRQYTNLIVPATFGLYITTYSGNLGTVRVTALGGDF